MSAEKQSQIENRAIIKPGVSAQAKAFPPPLDNRYICAVADNVKDPETNLDPDSVWAIVQATDVQITHNPVGATQASFSNGKYRWNGAQLLKVMPLINSPGNNPRRIVVWYLNAYKEAYYIETRKFNAVPSFELDDCTT